MRNLASKNPDSQNFQRSISSQQSHGAIQNQHFFYNNNDSSKVSKPSLSTSTDCFRSLKRLNEAPITGPFAANLKRTNKGEQHSNQSHTILTTNGSRLTFCQPSTSLPSTFANSFLYNQVYI